MKEKISTPVYLQQSGAYVGMPSEFNQSVKDDIFRFIEKEHYRGVPRQEDGEVNPYQYCYGLGYTLDNYRLFGGMIAGYPTQAFQNYCPQVIEKYGNSWVSANVANIYRIVAYYPEHANELLTAWEKAAVKRGIEIAYSMPTKEEKDAVCNFGWFERQGFKHVATTENKGARLYVKDIAQDNRGVNL